MDKVLIYILRVWRQPARFRAALRAVGEEGTQCFDSPEGLAHFVDEAAHADAAGAPSATPPASEETP